MNRETARKLWDRWQESRAEEKTVQILTREYLLLDREALRQLLADADEFDTGLLISTELGTARLFVDFV